MYIILKKSQRLYMRSFIIGGVDTEFFKSVFIMLQDKNYVYTTSKKLKFTRYK